MVEVPTVMIDIIGTRFRLMPMKSMVDWHFKQTSYPCSHCRRIRKKWARRYAVTWSTPKDEVYQTKDVLTGGPDVLIGHPDTLETFVLKLKKEIYGRGY